MEETKKKNVDDKGKCNGGWMLGDVNVDLPGTVKGYKKSPTWLSYVGKYVVHIATYLCIKIWTR